MSCRLFAYLLGCGILSENHGKLFFFFFPISYENFFWDFSIWFLFLNWSVLANQMFLQIVPLAKFQLWPLPNSPIKPHLAQVKKSKWFLLRPKRSFMLLYCFVLIKTEILVEIDPKDDNKLFHAIFCQSICIDSPWIFWREKKIWNDLFFRLSCYPIVPHTPTVGTIMVILYSSVIFWCSAIKDIVWGHGRMAVKSYIPSTINVRGKLLIPVIWADKNGLVFGKLACTSSTRSIRL